MSTVSVQQDNFRKNKIHPLKFALWVGCGSLVMMFTALTSAYLVRQAAGNWLEFELPNQFFISTGVIVASSIVMHLSFLSFKRGNELGYKLLLILTFILGLGFLFFQYQGWNQMMEMGVPLRTNPSGDFVYVISWVHAAHVVGGIAVLIMALLHAFLLPFKVTEKRKLRFELSLTYWHFVDILWLYLIGFLLVTQG